MTSYVTRQEAMDAALEHALSLPDIGDVGASILTCVCGRQDLHDLDHHVRTHIMQGCGRCECLVIGPGGTA